LVIGFIEHLQIVTTSNYSAIANSHTLQFTTARKKYSVCCVFASRCLVAASTPSIPQVKVKFKLRLTVSQSVSLGVEPHLGRMTGYLLLFDSCGLALRGALSDERRRRGLSFVCAAGPCQRSLSRVRVPWDSRPYFTVSDFSLSLMLRQTVSQLVCLGLKHPSGAYYQIFIIV
jgi:hypothetical protein